MRRWVAVACALALMGTGCSGASRVRAAMPCRLGSPPAAGEITWVEGGRLMAVGADGQHRHCLADGAGSSPRWDGHGDSVLLGNARALRPAGGVTTGFSATDHVAWSPAGTSLIAVTADGRLVKHPAAGGAEADISVLNRYDAAIYHPGGQAIVAVGEGDSEQGYGIYLADSTGAIQAVLAAGETTKHMDSLAWTAEGDLVFVAQHEDRWDLHRLQLLSGRITTLASTPGADAPITDLVASPFPGGGLAWRQGDCATGAPPSTHLVRNGELLNVPAEAAAAKPVGWLPDGTLVLAGRDTPCGTDHGPAPSGHVFALTNGALTTVVAGPADATVRVVPPPAPELPETVPSDAPI